MGPTLACLIAIAPQAPWSFLVAGDSRDAEDVWEQNIWTMVNLDPDAAMLLNGGDITAHGERGEWDAHFGALAGGAPATGPSDPTGVNRNSRVRADVTEFSPDWIRYFGVVGNHDNSDSQWLENWNDFLSGQQAMGENSTDGIYFSFTYENAMFFMLDSEGDVSRQTSWLRDELQKPEALAATWKLAMFHHPVYPCNAKSPWTDGLEWVDIFEEHNFDIVFVAHSHTYERTCPMRDGHCADDGVIYLNTSGAAQKRDVYPDKSVNGLYDCAEILDAQGGDWYHFCHFIVEDGRLDMACYSHDNTDFAEDTLSLVKDGAGAVEDPPVEDPPVSADCVDADSDGFGAPGSSGCRETAEDCDDSRSVAHPGGHELCNGLDDDCDGAVDNGVDMLTDQNNCGACGHRCGGDDETCTGGECVPWVDDGEGTKGRPTSLTIIGHSSCNAAPGSAVGLSLVLLLLHRRRLRRRRR